MWWKRSLLACLLLPTGGCATVAAEQAPVAGAVSVLEPAPGFALPRFRIGYPVDTFTYEGREARRLARYVVPLVAQEVTSAVVTERVVLPTSGYAGLHIDLTLRVRPAQRYDSVCEEPHVRISMDYEATAPFGSLEMMRFRFTDEGLDSHSLARLDELGRYVRVPERPASVEGFRQACDQLATDMSKWQWAPDASEFHARELRYGQLVEAIGAVPMARISCTVWNGKSCNADRARLLAFIQNAKPGHSEAHSIPGGRRFLVYDFRGPDLEGLVGKTTSLSVTVESDRTNSFLSLEMRIVPVLPIAI